MYTHRLDVISEVNKIALGMTFFSTTFCLIIAFVLSGDISLLKIDEQSLKYLEYGF